MENGIFLTTVFPMIASIAFIPACLLIIPIWKSAASSVALSFGAVFLFYTFFLHRRVFKIALLMIPLCVGIYIFRDLRNDPLTFNSRFPIWHQAVHYSLANLKGWGLDSYRNFHAKKNFVFMADHNYNPGIMMKLPDGSAWFAYYLPKASVTSDFKPLIDGSKPLETADLLQFDKPHN